MFVCVRVQEVCECSSVYVHSHMYVHMCVFACVWMHTHMICQESFPIAILPCAVRQGLSNPELTNNDWCP